MCSFPPQAPGSIAKLPLQTLFEIYDGIADLLTDVMLIPSSVS